MNPVASFVPPDVLVMFIGALLLALQTLAISRYKKLETSVEKMTATLIEVDKRLAITPTIEQMTNMGTRLTAERQSAVSEQNAAIRVLDRDVDRLKFAAENHK